jgi:hypothetical protein
MKTAAKTPVATTNTAAEHTAANGKSLPAVPVLQQASKDEQEPPLQMMAASAAASFDRFSAHAIQKVERAASYTPFSIPTVQRKAAVGGQTRFASQQALQMKADQNAAGEVVQMVKASELQAIGRQWHSEIWIRSDVSKKKEMIEKIERDTGFKSGTVFQAYDLYIRGAGPSAYKDIVKTLEKKDAETFLSFLNDEVDFENLGGNLPKLAVIVCVSETGRGYDLGEMRGFMEKIISGETTWSGVKENYAPSLTYKEDAFDKIGEYRPGEEDEGHNEEMSEEDEEPISEDEATEMREGAEASVGTGGTRSGMEFH